MLVHLDNCVFQILISNGFHGTLFPLLSEGYEEMTDTPKYMQRYTSTGLIVSVGLWSLPTAFVNSASVFRTSSDSPREVAAVFLFEAFPVRVRERFLIFHCMRDGAAFALPLLQSAESALG